MSKYVIVGGFLGAGKTTTMLALAEKMKLQGRTPSILVNDLGAHDLVDARFTEAMGYASHMIHGGCICWLHEELLEKIRMMRDSEGAELILSDIPGCGIGALEHVYHMLDREHPGEVELAPFTAIVDPLRLQRLSPQPMDLHLPEELDYIFDAQMKEAEVIGLNKIDLMTEEETEELADFLRDRYPHAVVFPISARTGEGIEDLLDWLMKHASSLQQPELGTDTPAFAAAEEWLSWYDSQFTVEGGYCFDGNHFTADLMDGIRSALAAVGRNVPHLKVMGENGGESVVKISLIGVDEPLSIDRELTEPCEKLDIYLNARAACEADLLQEICGQVIRATARNYGLQMADLYMECINMMED